MVLQVNTRRITSLNLFTMEETTLTVFKGGDYKALSLVSLTDTLNKVLDLPHSQLLPSTQNSV